jgi:hypothetical protein
VSDDPDRARRNWLAIQRWRNQQRPGAPLHPSEIAAERAATAEAEAERLAVTALPRAQQAAAWNTIIARQSTWLKFGPVSDEAPAANATDESLSQPDPPL